MIEVQFLSGTQGLEGKILIVNSPGDGMADVRDSKSRAARHKSSSLFPGTKIKTGHYVLFLFLCTGDSNGDGSEGDLPDPFRVGSYSEPRVPKAQRSARVAGREQ